MNDLPIHSFIDSDTSLDCRIRVDLNRQAVERCMARLFGEGRPPRSLPYKLGVQSVLLEKINGTWLQTECPYEAGSVEFDAYGAGIREGYTEALRMLS